MPSYIKLLNLEGHEEGGYFGVFYKSLDKVIPLSQRYYSDKGAGVDNERYAGSSIYFLLDKQGFSAWHRLKSDEIWHYYDGGSPIDIHVIDESGKLTTYTIGNPAITPEATFQAVIKAGNWFAAEVRNKVSFGLVGCTVSPAFEYSDFELAESYKDDLLIKYPDLKEIIIKFIEPKVLSVNVNQEHNHAAQSEIRNKLSAKDYIKNFGLQKHIEGGYYGVVYKADDMVIPLNSRYENSQVAGLQESNGEKNVNEQRSEGTSIYFLLDSEDFSAWHTLKSDEIWHYYDGGSPIDIHVLDEDRKLTTYSLGNPLVTTGASFQVVIKAGSWFAAEVRDKSSFGLVGCTVTPGFEFRDFVLGNQKELLSMYPEHTSILKRLSRIEPEKTKASTSGSVIGRGLAALMVGIGFRSFMKGNNNVSSSASDIKSKFEI